MSKRLFLSLILILFSTQPLFGQWRQGGLPVCTDPEGQYGPHIVTDGSGGAIVIWYHPYRDDDILYMEARAQRIDPDGALLWGSDGVSVIPDMWQRAVTDVIPDGAGGAIMVFIYQYGVDDRDIYAQRINEYGAALWSSGGIAVCTEDDSQASARCVSDGSGGAIIVWEDDRYGAQGTYAQRVSGDGVCLWAENGVAVSLEDDFETGQRIAADGFGGALIVWWDRRSGIPNTDIFAQRIDQDGVVQWADDVPVCAEIERQSKPEIVSDGSHAGIVVWQDWRDGYEPAAIYAQKIDSNGQLLWDEGGVLMGSYYDSYDLSIIPDGSGGAIAAYDSDEGDRNIFVQRISGDGDILWGAGGIVVCDVAGDQYYPEIITDSSGGAIVIWRSTLWEYYAQRFDPDGNALWTVNGIVVCDEADYNGLPAIMPDGAEGTILAWSDLREGSADIYAQRIDADGEIVVTSDSAPVSCRLFENYPNPFNPTTMIRFHLSERSDVRIDIYDVNGAHVTRLASAIYEKGVHSIPWDGRSEEGRAVSSGIFFCRLTAGIHVLSHKMVLLR